MLKLGIIGDYNASNPSHVATSEAFEHATTCFGTPFQYEWVDTERIEAEFDAITRQYDAYLISPGSPYRSMQGVLKIIEYARTHKVPTLGTCGGFQHMAIEFARNVLGIQDADHAESNPYASRLVINPLSCFLKGQPLEVQIVQKDSLVYSIFNSEQITESYYCNFGLNTDYQQAITEAGFNMVGTDRHKEVRILELTHHPFFIATLFVPQHNSGYEKPHPLIVALLHAMEQCSRTGTARVTGETGVK